MGLRSVKPRKKKPRFVVLHWSGGINGLATLFAVLLGTKGPRTPDGLSVHKGIAPDGTVETWADDDQICLHAGVANDPSLGIEVCSPGYSTGTVWQKEKKKGVVRREYEDRIRGLRVRMVEFTDAQLEAIATVVEAWCAKHDIPRVVPTEADGSLMRRQMTDLEAAAFRGVAGHYHFHKEKNDPGTAVFLYLAKRWGLSVT